MNLQQDRPVPNHPLLRQYLPEATPSDSWSETYKTISQLDGLLCVDTAIAHLVGWLGFPRFSYPVPCDWRWGINGPPILGIKSLILRRRWKPISDLHLQAAVNISVIRLTGREHANVGRNRHTTLQVQTIATRLASLLRV